MSSKPTSPRGIAVDALRDRSGHVSARLDRLVDKIKPAPADRSLARELALGVHRRQGTIKQVLRAFLKRPKRPIPSAVKQILHVAIYQLIWLDRVPDFAAVDEAVNLTRAFHQPRYANMVNAVLRSIERSMTDRLQGQAPFDVQAVPVDPTSHVRFDKPILPDPGKDAPAYLAGAHSLPPVLVSRWLKQFHNAKKVAQLGYCANARAPLVVRVNTAKISLPEMLSRLADENAPARAHANGRSVVFETWPDLPNLPSFQAGLLAPQDPTPTEVGAATAVRAGMNVLDFCAAPGTKSLQMAEMMNNTGRIVAVDVSQDKLDLVGQGADRVGCDIIETCLAQEIGRLDPRSFDVVLVDVPCSNTGVLARRPEARWRFDLEAFRKLVRDQRLLLQAAASFCKPGGRLVYGTCSIENEENIEAAQWADRHIPSLQLREKKLLLPAGATDPTAWHDGGFYAVFES
ncbi:MAG: transcription antitermination factor NusB [Phycisphaerae bacterium]